jgi:predicted amidohydrolase YtcJ
MASAEEPGFTETLERGPDTGSGDGMLTLRGVKVVLDGALGSRGAELSAPYSDAPQQRGLAIVSDSALDSIIARAVARGFQVNVHAIGDAANHRVLDAFERAGSVARRLRFRDEHVSMLRDEDVPRLAKLGVIASMQPVFVGEYSRFAEARVGAERLPWVYRTRDVLASGALIASGTDYPASDIGDPISTLFSLVTRRGADGAPPNGWLPAQKIGLDDALRSMTAGPAYAAFQEATLGALTVGRLADFTVLSDDPHAVAPDEIRGLRVVATVVGGKVRYWKGDGRR